MAKSTSKLFADERIKEMPEDAMNLPEEEVTEQAEEEKDEPRAEHNKEERLEKEVVDQHRKDEPEEKEEVANPDDDIQDIDLSQLKKQRFRINKDNSKILELNTRDMGIAHRLSVTYPELNNLMDEVADKFSKLPENSDEVSDEEFDKLAKTVKKIDDVMREKLDYIFDAPVSEVCGDGGSMWDPIDGAFRYEHIIDKLASLYENNLSREFSKMRRRVESKTSKYTNVRKYHN